MKVSVIITSFNRADTLRRAIDSVLMQVTDFPVQVIIVDDGSADGSRDIINSYPSQKGNIRINKHLLNHRGMMKNYDYAFKLCIGEFITFADCDDYWLVPDRLQRYADYMDARPEVGFCTSRIITERYGEKIDTSLKAKEALKRLTFDNLLKGNAAVYAQGYFIRKSVFDKYIDFGMFSKKFLVWDYPIILELIRRTNFGQLNYVTAVFFVSKESKTMTCNRLKRFNLIMGYAKIRWYYIFKYGCKFSTLCYVVYKFVRDLLSIILKRWY